MRTVLPVLAAILGVLPAMAQDNPVSNGSFEVADANGVPADWSLLGSARVETGEAHSGKQALHLWRTPETQGEVGLNRGWDQGSGQQGTMLAERKGGLRFWYKAVAAEPGNSLTVQAIPMNERPLEVGGNRVVWRIPPMQVGDGQWHAGELAYDFTGLDTVRWVHVSARLIGEVGDLWLDDFEWIPEAGPSLQATDLTLTETKGREGEEATVTLTLGNPGGKAVPPGTASLTLPEGLRATPAEAGFGAIEPGETAEMEWKVVGRRDRIGEKLTVVAKAGAQETGASVTLEPKVVLGELRAERMILTAKQTVTVQLLARNEGTAIAPPPKCTLTGPDSLRIEAVTPAGGLAPGAEGAAGSWRVTALRPALLARLHAAMEGVDGELTSPLTVVDELPEDLRAEGRVYCRREGDQVALGSNRTRLILRKGADGYGLAALQTAKGGKWQTVGYLPRLGLLATENAEVALAASGVECLQSERDAVAVSEGKARIAGVEWRFSWALTASSGSPCIDYQMTATPGADAEITALEGPMLYAGEGGTPERDDAIVPGLEWLVKGEESSNALDIKPEHPDCLRYVPHPYKVTIPAVGVKVGGATVGLMWDVPESRAFASEAGPPSLVFASPNRFEGHTNHLMGLFLPSVGEHVPENERRATEPLRLKAGQELFIRASLFADAGAADSLAVVDEWFARYGVPEPLPYPRGDLQKELAFSLSGYSKDHALWNPEWGKWYSDLIVGFRPDTSPASWLLRGADVLGTGQAAEEARALVAEVMGGDARSQQLQLQHKANPDAIYEQARSVRGLIASQHEDGTWRFGGEKAGEWPEEGVNYKVLGPVGASEVGLSARNATAVLEFALLTGDADATAAGLRALQAMRQFRVPRAAQVWEVPVHTPDILASGQATDAYLAGYRLTGDEQYLKEAIYWARSGLPFVYVWSAPDQPAMQGASIPVFGATAYVLSWFGVAVQWNGLAYASALEDLAPYDPSFPWQRVADNVVRSAMYQQATEGERLAQWPDAMNFIAGRKGAHGQTPPCFQPSTIVRETLRAMGQHPDLVTEIARRGKQHLAVRAQAKLDSLAWRGERLTFTATFAPTQAGAIEVIGTERPGEVRLNGTALPERTDVWRVDEPGWRWHEQAADLEIRAIEAGEYEVEVTGVAPATVVTLPPALTDIDFRFTESLNGWQAQHDLAALRIENGALRTTTIGPDPYMARDSFTVEGRAGDEIVIRMSLTGGGDGASVYWATAAAGMTGDQTVSFPIPHDGAVHEVRVPVGTHAKWAGQTITVFRIDPGGGAPGSEVAIESVRLER